MHPKIAVTLLITCLLAACSLVAGATPTEPSPAEHLKTAADELHHWLQTSGEVDGWRKFLNSDLLEAQLAKDAKVDRLAVYKIVAAYQSDRAELRLAPFVKTRQALDTWLDSLPAVEAADLPRLCREAKPLFAPVTAEQLAAARTALQEAAAGLDVFLTAQSKIAPGWRIYLKWDDSKAQLAKDAPNVDALEQIYFRYCSGAAGLEMAAFAPMRTALRHYVVTARARGTPELQAKYDGVLDQLAAAVERYAKQPTAEDGRSIAAALAWLDDTRQVTPLVKDIRRRLSHPNLLVEVAAGLAGAGIAGPFHETAPIQDNISDTAYQGSSTTTGQVTVELVPAEHVAEMDIVYHGTTRADTVGYNSAATIRSSANTTLDARKRLTLDEHGMHTAPLVPRAVTNSTIEGVQSAYRSRRGQDETQSRVYQEKSSTEQITARRVEQTVQRRMDHEIDATVAGVGRGLSDERRRLWDQWLATTELHFATSAEKLFLRGLQSGGDSLGAPGPAPDAAAPGELAVRIHESAVVNTALAMLAGRTLEEANVQAALSSALGMPAPPPDADEPEQRWTITLARQTPVTVEFGKNAVTMLVRAEKFTRGAEEYPGMDVSLVYQLGTVGGDLAATLGDRPQIFPPGFGPRAGKRLSVRQQVLRTMLERRLDKMFPKQWTPGPVSLPAAWAKAGPLQLAQWRADGGWLVLCWRRAPAAGK
jgi:hypothetical protein